MNFLTINILLAFIWAHVTGEFTLGSFATGFLLGYIVLFIASPVLDSGSYIRKFPLVIWLFVYFLKELFLSSIRVAIDVLRPGSFKMHSGVIGIPLDVKTDFEITLLANMISLTPGTLSLDVSEDRKTLFIHAMYVDNDDVESVRSVIKNGMERMVIKTLR